MNLIDFQKALGPIKATKTTVNQTFVLKLNNDSVVSINFTDGEFRKYTVDGKNKQETVDLIEDYIKKHNKNLKNL